MTDDRALDVAAAAVTERVDDFPRIAVVAGSGLGAIAGEVDNAITIDYGDIPGFPSSGVKGHAGQMVVGDLGGVRVVILSGRKHLYEGVTFEQSTFAPRLLSRLGVRELILSNAAGGVSRQVHPGDLMLIVDHVNISNRGVPMGQAPEPSRPQAYYSQRLMAIARDESTRLGIPLREGVYCVNLGPTYETRAEVRFARLAGADAVGMSTVPEVMAAVGAGVETLAISCVTNSHVYGVGETTHGDVIEVAKRVEAAFISLIRAVVARIDAE